ncbi:MAG: 30S ribosomal protein S4 [Anaerolineaceae bacterium]|nr:30S ribosomal protein S4 [Anaerolineaceae bacterium]
MARYIGPVCKLCRREGEKLFLKGQRCFTPKCAMEKRPYPPGDHGRSRTRRPGRVSDYGRQLRAKQKARRVYGVLERQFRRYYSNALRKRGQTGLNVLQTLEMRLDNVVFRMGYARNRNQARQLVSHGHFVVNGRRTDIPSMVMKLGDKLNVREESRKKPFFKELNDISADLPCAMWLERDLDNLSGRVLRAPERGEIDGNLNEQLIVEYYSR